MTDTERLTPMPLADTLSLATSGMTKVSQRGAVGITMVTYGEIEAMALMLAYLVNRSPAPEIGSGDRSPFSPIKQSAGRI